MTDPTVPDPADPRHAVSGAVAPTDPAGVDRLTLTVPDPAAMNRLGRALGGVLRAGDLVVLGGELGAGKTTLTRGVGEGMGVRGAVTSPTFVIARVHPPTGTGPALVHVDAYRLSGGLEEMEDLDLDVSLTDSVVVVEWGEGRVEELTEDRLHVRIERTAGAEGPEGDARRVTLEVVGGRRGLPDPDLLRRAVAGTAPASGG